MREIISHKTNSCNEAIEISTDVESNYRYVMAYKQKDGGAKTCTLQFQNGPIAEVGVNGITNEALLAIVIDRLQHFQKGGFACRENALALTKLEKAAHWLNHRTQNRVARGVEGTYQK